MNVNAANPNINKQELVQQYLKFISLEESQLLSKAFQSFHEADFDDLVEFCSEHSRKRISSSSNILEHVAEIAHAELVQESAYIGECMREKMLLLKPLLAKTFSEMSSLIPDFKRVWNALVFDESCTKSLQDMLKKFLKQVDRDKLVCFLRFTTGKKSLNSN